MNIDGIQAHVLIRIQWENALGLIWVHLSLKNFHEICANTGISTCAYMRGNRVCENT